MIKLMKQIIKNTPFLYPLRKWVVKRRRNGKTVPPPHIVKQRTLRTYSRKFGLKILVETGTLYGDMVEAMKKVFDHIYSIELSKELYEKAKERFKGVKHIELICGDSGIELGNVMNKIEQPALFWLDGHEEKDTPIYEELHHILNASDRGHVIIIDDARCFGPDSTWPSIEELKDFIRSKRPTLEIVIRDDMIRVTPRQYPPNKKVLN